MFEFVDCPWIIRFPLWFWFAINRFLQAPCLKSRSKFWYGPKTWMNFQHSIVGYCLDFDQHYGVIQNSLDIHMKSQVKYKWKIQSLWEIHIPQLLISLCCACPCLQNLISISTISWWRRTQFYRGYRLIECMARVFRIRCLNTQPLFDPMCVLQ